MSEILEKAKSIEDYIINFRRDLHKNPELSGEEYETQAKIINELVLKTSAYIYKWSFFDFFN